MEQPTQDIRPDWLRGLAEKTWNMELIISGAATYLTSFLPELTDKAFYFVLDNYMDSTEMSRIDMPLLAYSFLKMVSYLLPATFVVHFAMRAFWASLVGVHTVYPQGILYNNLHGHKNFAQQIYRERFGRLSDYIMRMDKLCNQVFGFAFAIVLFGIGLGMVYLMVFGINLLFKSLLPGAFSNATSTFLGILGFLAIASQTLLSKLSEEKFPRIYKFLSNLVVFLPQLMFPLVHKPFNYLNLAFSSNVTKWKFYSVMFSVMAILMGGVFVVMFSTMGTLRQIDRPLAAAQSFWGISYGGYAARAESYGDQLPPNARPNSVVLPSEMVTGPLMKVFLPYPKRWDAALAKYCTISTYPDSIPKPRRRFLEDSTKVACFAEHLRLAVNDSAFSKIDWVFQRHATTGMMGLTTYLPTQHFKMGKNALRATLTSVTRADSVQVLGEVPFWFGRE